jgi:hypothetical protein
MSPRTGARARGAGGWIPPVDSGISRARFGEAILRADRSRLPITLQSFPHGACGDASLLLGEFLAAHGYTRCAYVSGALTHDRHFQSHAWLDVDGIIVDRDYALDKPMPTW